MELVIYYGLAILGFVIVLLAQLNINSSYKKNKQIRLKKDLTGQEIARKILDTNGLNDIYVVSTKGELTDHYDPKRKVVRLSNDIFNGNNIAAAGVAAHECGHAIQDKVGYSFMRIRSFLVPFVNLVSYLGYFGLIVSLLAGITGYLKISILILLVTILFQLVTLPVEFVASKRAKEQLITLGILVEEEKEDVSGVLTSAALTYVASLLSNLLQLLRLVILLSGRDD